VVKMKNNDNLIDAVLIPHDAHLASDPTSQASRDSQHNKPNRWRKFLKYQTSLLVALSLSTFFIFIAISLYDNVAASRYQQVDMLVHSLLDYPTKTAANLIVARDSADSAIRLNSNTQLQRLVDEVSENQYVTSLNIFAENGQLLSSSQDNYIEALMAAKQYSAPTGVRVYLKPILADNHPVGFLQLHFDYQKMLKTFAIFQFDATKSILILLLLLLLLGVIIGVTINRVHHKFRTKR